MDRMVRICFPPCRYPSPAGVAPQLRPAWVERHNFLYETDYGPFGLANV